MIRAVRHVAAIVLVGAAMIVTLVGTALTAQSNRQMLIETRMRLDLADARNRQMHEASQRDRADLRRRLEREHAALMRAIERLARPD